MQHLLTPQQQQWIDRTLNGLSLEQAILQLFNVSRFRTDPAEWLNLFETVASGLYIGAHQIRRRLSAAFDRSAENHAPIPLLVVANMETWCRRMARPRHRFPHADGGWCGERSNSWSPRWDKPLPWKRARLASTGS